MLEQSQLQQLCNVALSILSVSLQLNEIFMFSKVLLKGLNDHWHQQTLSLNHDITQCAKTWL